MTEKKKKYYNIFVPAPDVYEDGGTELFESLRQDDTDKPSNLLVIPKNYLDLLYRRKSKSYAVEDSLKEISAISKHQLDSTEPVGYPPRSYGSGHEPQLEAIILHGESGSSPENVQKFLKEQYEMVSDKEKPSRERGPLDGQPKFMTSDPRTEITLSASRLRCVQPEFIQVDETIVYEGILEPDDNEEVFNTLYSNNGSIPLEQAIELMERDQKGMDINQFVRLRVGEETKFAQVVGDFEYDETGTKIIDVHSPRLELLAEHEYSKKVKIGDARPQKNILGITPKNMEQYLAFQKGLFDPEIELMFLTGSHGSGKTILAYMAAVHQTLSWDKQLRLQYGYVDKAHADQKRGRYDHIIPIKPPNELIGRDTGYLPGTLYDKLEDHLKPYEDAHSHPESELRGFPFEQMIANPNFANKYASQRTFDGKIAGGAYLPADNEVFKIMHIGHIRGRSIPSSIILVDEGQNLTPFEAKTLCARSDSDTKVVYVGDPFQVDNPRNTRKRNGLTHAIKHFKDKPYTMMLHMTENFRSQMSEDSLDWKVYPS